VAVSEKDLIQAVSGRQLAMERQLSELAGTIKALQARVGELSQPSAIQSASAPKTEVKAASAKDAAHREAGEVTPEILVVKKVRIRSAKMLQSSCEVVNPWSQQGRMLVHASHHPRIRG
jgi:hypothetical protein